MTDSAPSDAVEIPVQNLPTGPVVFTSGGVNLRYVEAAEVERSSASRRDDEFYCGPFDPDELVRWAETYGDPEQWAKKAQALHGKVERLEWDNSTLRTERAAAIASATLGLAQTLRLIRDTCPSSAASGMAAGALERAGIKDPEDDCDVF